MKNMEVWVYTRCDFDTCLPPLINDEMDCEVDVILSPTLFILFNFIFVIARLHKCTNAHLLGYNNHRTI